MLCRVLLCDCVLNRLSFTSEQAEDGAGEGTAVWGGAELNFREGALEALKVVQSCCQREKECSSDQWAASMNSRRFAHHSDESTGGGGKWDFKIRIFIKIKKV
ncbi:hypothetical protein TYRP_017261 [Tyrophagus putrescentiae]|nr:hypothetical protein TYRP_017261 [Tyrophagus putrescentiae]